MCQPWCQPWLKWEHVTNFWNNVFLGRSWHYPVQKRYCTTHLSTQLAVWAPSLGSIKHGAMVQEDRDRGEGGNGWSSPALSSARSIDIHTGRAWAPAHLQAGERVPGSYMLSAVGSMRLELEREGGRGLSQVQRALASLVKELSVSTSVETLFCGRCSIGRWRQSRGCGGTKTKKHISSKFPNSCVLAIANLIERRLVLGPSESALAGQPMPSVCTRVIVLPGQSAAASRPIDITDCKDIKIKYVENKRLRVEIVQQDDTSLWLYRATHTDYRAIADCIKATRSYSEQKQAVLEKPASHCTLAASPTAVSAPEKPAPTIPKLKLEGVGNYPPPAQAPEPAQWDQLNGPIPRPSAKSNCPPSMSTAVREAEALLASNPLPRTHSNGDAKLTATTEHVYVQGSGEANHAHPIYRIGKDELERALSSKEDPGLQAQNLSRVPPTTAFYSTMNPSSHAENGFANQPPLRSESDYDLRPSKQPRATQNRNSVINVASSASTAANSWTVQQTSHAQAEGEESLWGDAPPFTTPGTTPGVGAMHLMSANFKVISPPPRRLPRLVSASPSPQKKIVADPHVMKQALADVLYPL